MFKSPSFLVSVSDYEGRTLEELLAVAHPATPPVAGAVLDATYLATDPPLWRRLEQLRIPRMIAPQSNRFATDHFLAVNSVKGLPYAPDRALGRDPSNHDLETLVRGSLAFQDRHGVDFYLIPSLPFLKPLGADADCYERIYRFADLLIGSEFPIRPVLAFATPGPAVLRSPYALFSRLSDRRIAGVYLQPTQFNPRSDSVERLIAYINFARCASEYNWPVIASRMSAFGLLLCALGIAAFDSGLAQRESFDLKSLQRARKVSSSGRPKGGRARRIYLHQLLTTVSEKEAKAVLENLTLRSHFICESGACRFNVENQIDRHKEHFYHSRTAEMAAMSGAPTREMRLDAFARMLTNAIECANLTNRVLTQKGHPPIRLDHLNRWQAALARATGRPSWRRAS